MPVRSSRIRRKAILLSPAEGVAQVRVLPHPDPLYRIEGQLGRLAEGIYDKMGPTGAHEVVVETPQHDRRFSQFSDDEIDRVLTVWASRIADLKKDVRFKYISVFKNQGLEAGEEWSHAHSQVTATIFVPRRIKYELNAAHEWYKERERCIFCDMVRQEEKKALASWTSRANITRSAPTLRASLTRFGSSTANTITSSSSRTPDRIAKILPLCSAECCAAWKSCPRHFTW